MLTALLSFLLFQFTDRYAAVLLIRDRWQSLTPLFESSSFWEGFTHQHGPHRMGWAYVLFKANASLSGWNSRWDMFTQVTLFVLSAVMALRLKFILFQKWHWSDVLIPMIFITLHAAINITLNPYIHGLIPFWALLACLSYFITNIYWRTSSLSLLTFTGVFSGFTLVVSGAIVFLELLKMLRQKGSWAASLCIALSGLAGFFYMILTQRSDEASFLMAPDTPFSFWMEYSLLLSGNFIFSSVNPQNYWLGILVLVAIIPLMVMCVKSFFSSNSKGSEAYLILLASSFIFIILNTYGRTDNGLFNALNSRYIPATMPMVLFIYLASLRLKPYAIRSIYLIAFSLLILRFQLNRSARTDFVKREYHQIQKLEECLLKGNTYASCSEKVNCTIHPKPEQAQIEQKLKFFRENGLNIYRSDREVRKQP